MEISHPDSRQHDKAIWRISLVFFMGFSSGLPLLITLSTLTYWLRKVGVDLTTIGIFALVGTPYTFKYLWSPLIDHFPLPFLTRLLGRRRAFALVTQVALIFAILALGFSDPAVNPGLTALCAVAVAFLSASQDIVLDAFRIDLLKNREQGLGASAMVTGYRIGMLVAGAGALWASDYISWPLVFAALAACMSVGIVTVLIAPEPAVPFSDDEEKGLRHSPVAVIGTRLKTAILEPFVEFFFRRSKSYWFPLAILCFIVFYKVGDAVGGIMANPFYVDLAFTGSEIAAITKVWGLLATLIGIFIGGLMIARWGLFVGLCAGGLLQALTNFFFMWLATSGHDLFLLALAISCDNLAGGMGTAALVAYLSLLCNRNFSATQYALLSSFASFGRTLFSSYGGWLAQLLGWPFFFALTVFLAIPGLCLLVILRLCARPGDPLRPLANGHT